MPKKSEHLRRRLKELKDELRETEKNEARRAREHALRLVTRSARRSGLLAAVSQRESAPETLLEREFTRLAARLEDFDSPTGGTSHNTQPSVQLENQSRESSWHGGNSE